MSASAKKVKKRTSLRSQEEKSKEFRGFQTRYLLVYVLTMFADWLQGTHMYALYDGYVSDQGTAGADVGPYHPSNYGKTAISTLFITGFACSGIFGTFIGSLADRYGRKAGVALFCLLEIAINCMEEVEDMRVLLLGRLLGGISTSLLFTSFESWMVAEHRARGYPEKWLANTFGYCQVGNGISAILAGFVAEFSVGVYGNIGPFRLAVMLSAIVFFIVVFTWRENRDNQKNKTALGLFPIAWEKILNDPKIMLVGFTNAFFEGAMYTFVFNWVPSMYNVWKNPPLGNVFSSFMTCITLGGFIYNYLSSSINMTNGEIMLYVLLFASISLMLPAIDPDHFYFVYGGFLVFETCVGVSFACGGGLRSAVMPEELQATIMNIFRIPLNILVVIGTRLDSFATTRQVFLVCVSWLLVALLLQYWFMKRNMMESILRAAKGKSKKTKPRKARKTRSKSAGTKQKKRRSKSRKSS